MLSNGGMYLMDADGTPQKVGMVMDEMLEIYPEEPLEHLRHVEIWGRKIDRMPRRITFTMQEPSLINVTPRCLIYALKPKYR